MIIPPTAHDRAFEECSELLLKALDTIDATIEQIETAPTEEDFSKEYWRARRDAVQRAYNTMLGQVWIEHYRDHDEPASVAIGRAHAEGRTIHAWASHIQEVEEAAMIIGEPPPLTIEEALKIYAREPGRIYVRVHQEAL